MVNLPPKLVLSSQSHKFFPSKLFAILISREAGRAGWMGRHKVQARMTCRIEENSIVLLEEGAPVEKGIKGLFLVEPEGGDLLADGVDVASGDGAHDDEADKDGNTDA